MPAGLMTYTNQGGNLQRIKKAADWQIKRGQILDSMQQTMGRLPAIDHADVPPTKVIATEKREGYTRYTIRFLAAPDEWVPAFLYIPEQVGPPERLPAMLALHGTGALGKRLIDGESPLRNRSYARELAEKGYVVIAPDYPSMGELSDYDFSTDRYESGTMKALVNHIRCLDLLVGRDDVDPDRMGVIGHSLGGHNAMFVGAFDERLKVVVASCGWTPFAYYDIGEAGTLRYGGKLGPWAQDRYMPLIREQYDLDPEKMPFDFPEVIAAIAPRAFFSNSPLNDSNFDVNGVKKGMEEAAPVYDLFRVGHQLQVRYPDATHDFPEEVRMEAYEFIDNILKK